MKRKQQLLVIFLILQTVFFCFLLPFVLAPGRRERIGVIVTGCLSLVCMIFTLYFLLRPVSVFFKELRVLSELPDPYPALKEASEHSEEMELVERLVNAHSKEQLRRDSAELFDKQTALMALQSQINPHFLYNTLDSIRGRALIEGNDEIARMLEALAAFFRYSISGREKPVTLRDELANIKNYMMIQQYRFNDRFSLEIVIDEEDEAAYDYQIPRLIIQPVVENAVFHGLEEMAGGGKIVIEIILTDENLILIISDNGKGIAPDTLKRLNERIHHPERLSGEEESISGGHRNTGIALPNIHRRIQLLYGDAYGVQVYSTPGQGTDVEITVPALSGGMEGKGEERDSSDK
ncbi:MAG: sensor histidine kinase [Lachnospiraceae bacterium]|nr:sensor histidine kinase [Lachnospiraceae bacterium]